MSGLIKEGRLGFNVRQANRTNARIKEMCPWTAGASGEKYWLKVISGGSYDKAREYRSIRHQSKKVAKQAAKEE